MIKTDAYRHYILHNDFIVILPSLFAKQIKNKQSLFMQYIETIQP